jgi:hypothetical protein
MEGERYPGETRGLRLFLEGLQSAVETELGRDSLLYHRVRTALERGDLAALRDARQMFNHQDSDLKRRLSLSHASDRPHLVYERADGDPCASATVLRLPPRAGERPPAD